MDDPSAIQLSKVEEASLLICSAGADRPVVVQTANVKVVSTQRNGIPTWLGGIVAHAKRIQPELAAATTVPGNEDLLSVPVNIPLVEVVGVPRLHNFGLRDLLMDVVYSNIPQDGAGRRELAVRPLGLAPLPTVDIVPLPESVPLISS